MSVCRSHGCTVQKETALPIEMPFCRLTRVDPRKRVLEVAQHRTNPLAASRGDKSAMRLFAQLLWALVILTQLSRWNTFSKLWRYLMKPSLRCRMQS